MKKFLIYFIFMPMLVWAEDITLSKATASVNESGTTDTFTVVLDTQPASEVVIGVTSTDTGEVTADLTSLTFTNGNWNTPQTVTLTGVDDATVDGNQNVNVTMAVNDASSDNAYDGLSKTVVATVVDDESSSSADPDNDGYSNGQENIWNTSIENNQSKPNSPDINKNTKNDIVFFDIESGKRSYSEFNATAKKLDHNVTLLEEGSNSIYPVAIIEQNTSDSNKSIFYNMTDSDKLYIDGETPFTADDFNRSKESIIGAGDYNNDSNGSFFSFETDKIKIYTRTAIDEYNTKNDLISVPTGYVAKAAGDVTHNGKIDFALINSTGEVEILEEGVSPLEVDKNASAYLRLIGIGDYSGDGQDDIVFNDIRNNNIHIWEIEQGDPLHVSNENIISTSHEQTTFPMGQNRYENDFDQKYTSSATEISFDTPYKAVMSDTDTDMFKIVLGTSKKINIYSEVDNESSGLDLSAKLVSEDGSIYLISSDAKIGDNRNFQIVTDANLAAGNYYLEVSNENNSDTSTPTNGYYVLHVKQATVCSALDNPDSDSDGICDRQDNAPYHANQNQDDVDGDGIGDCVDEWDRIGCDEELNDGPIGDFDHNGTVNYLDPDDDGDDMNDSYEISVGFDPYHKDNLNDDPDGDGYTTADEIALGSNPNSGSSIPVTGLKSGTAINISDSKITDSLAEGNFTMSATYNIAINRASVSINFSKDTLGTLTLSDTVFSDDNKTLTAKYTIADKNATVQNIGIHIIVDDYSGT